MFHSPRQRWLGRGAVGITGGIRSRRRLSLELLEARIVPVIGANGLAPEVARGGDLDGIVLIENGLNYGTGALLSTGRHILTAAHVVDNAKNLKRITFHLSRGDSEIDLTFDVPANSVLLNSSWVTGGPANQGNDLALLTLIDQVVKEANRHLVAPYGAQKYSLWSGNVLGEVVTLVGYGRTGTGEYGNYLDEVQRVVIDQPTSNGTFRLTFNGQTTAPISHQATREQLQAALEALSTIGAGNVEVSDRGLPAGTWEVRFVRQLGGKDVAELTSPNSNVEILELFAGGSEEMSRIKREGQNEIDYVNGQFLAFDFDNGTAANSTWGSTGLGPREAGVERGDSGSPLLVEHAGGYAIAGVLSWISTGGDRDFNNYPTPDGSFGTIATYISTKSHYDDFLQPGLSGDYHLVLDMQQQILGRDGIHEQLMIRAWRDGYDLVLSVYGSSDMRLNGDYYRAPVFGPGGRILSLTLRGSDDDETFLIDKNLGIPSITIDGRGGNDTLIVENQSQSQWKITGKNSGTVSTTSAITFTNIENLHGGKGNDFFAFEPSGQITGNLDGGEGQNTLSYATYEAPVRTEVFSVPMPGGPGGMIVLGPLPLDYTFRGRSTAIGGEFINFARVVGGPELDTLEYNGTGHTWWTISGRDTGNVNGFFFASMEHLVGDRWDDRFVFTLGASITGSIDGGEGRDLLDYSGYGQAVFVDLQTSTASAVGRFVSIEGVIGSSKNDHLIAWNTVNQWSITGPNEGLLNGQFSFLSIENLTGGDRRDVFTFASTGWMTGQLGGGGGSDWLDYRQVGQAITVNLNQRIADRTGGVSGIHHVWGSATGFNRLIGNAANNILIAFGTGNLLYGLGGRDFLVGGTGRNILHGGVGDDVTIAGSTSFDHDPDALDALMAEWSRGIGYLARVNNLRTGRGLTGGRALRYGASLFVPPPVYVASVSMGGQQTASAPRPLSRVFGNGGLDFFIVRFVGAAFDINRRQERFI